MDIADDATELIGSTPLVRLDAFADNLVAKVEAANPFSVKDRIARAMIERAEREGRLDAETTVIEPTSGNTGIGLALACAAKGYDLVLTMPESMSAERRKLLAALGADVRLTPADRGMDGAIAAADRLADEFDDAYVPQQFENEANPAAHRETTGPEIWAATDGDIGAFVAGIGTGGTITGVTAYLKEDRGHDALHAVGVEPASSPVLTGGDPGSHGIQGIGAGFVPDVLRAELLDEVVTVTEDDAKRRARELAANEGLVTGISSGAALHAAIEVAGRTAHADDLIVVVLPDGGERYLSTDLYEDTATAVESETARADD
ncbi:MAG: cysteine synthase A [Halosimplex sp.]